MVIHMSQFEVSFDQIAPYAQPENWGGNRIGADPLQSTPRARVPFLHYNDATTQLTDYLATTPSLLPVRSYKSGEEFDANDHAHGTVFAYNLEMVGSDQPFPEVENGPRPNAPLFAPIAYTIGEERCDVATMTHDGISYSRLMWWGVVAKTMRGNTLLSLPGIVFERQPGGAVTTKKRFETIAAFTVGRPYGNQNLHRGDAHNYNRVSAVDQMTYGSPKRAVRRSSAAWLQKIIPGIRPDTA